MIELKILIRCI